jgi:hypothetical protein
VLSSHHITHTLKLVGLHRPIIFLIRHRQRSVTIALEDESFVLEALERLGPTFSNPLGTSPLPGMRHRREAFCKHVSRVWFIHVISNYLLARWGSVPVIVCFVRVITVALQRQMGASTGKEGHKFSTSQAYPPQFALMSSLKTRRRITVAQIPKNNSADGQFSY